MWGRRPEGCGGATSHHPQGCYAVPAPKKVASVVPLKRPRNEIKPEGLLVNDDAFQILALNPKNTKIALMKKKKQCLRDDFHKRP